MASASTHQAVTDGALGQILVADDCRVVRAVVGGQLRKLGYRVEEAVDGAAALHQLRQGAFDVLITDLDMSEMDGFGLMQAAARLEQAPEVIVLTGTAANDMKSAVRALRLGAHDEIGRASCRERV